MPRVYAVIFGLALLAGCKGRLIVPNDPCDVVTCEGEDICVKGECVPPPDPCNADYPAGSCGTDRICMRGVCYPFADLPAACAAGVNGYCSDPEQACDDGTCRDIASGEGCGSGNPTGLCPGGERCVAGYCFPDSTGGGIGCSSANPEGACAPHEICSSGTCVSAEESCAGLNYEGDCAGWEICVQFFFEDCEEELDTCGECVGPVPPDACAPDNVDGLCPADEVCVAGTCTPLVVGTNTCSEERPNGLCLPASRCVEGSCFFVSSDDESCAPSASAGICPPGYACMTGDCEPVECGAGGWVCDTGTWCAASECIPLPCGPTNPSGVCLDSTETCDHGACVPPRCSLDEPDGICLTGFYCSVGECVPFPCSTEHQQGVCPQTQHCENGECVEDPCAPDNLDGNCDDRSTWGATCHPELGCHPVPSTCCDEALRASRNCTLGVCTPFLCSAEYPRGACPAQQYCNDAFLCVDAPCSIFFTGIECPGAGELCIQGGCHVVGCRGQPASFCGPAEVCDADANICVPTPCEASHLGGFCDLGYTCCDDDLVASAGCTAGQCVVPPCSVVFPGGTCPGGDEVCAGGQCVVPPCSAGNPDGPCQQNFRCCDAALATSEGCELGRCTLAPCNADNPHGRCDDADERCNGTTCVPFLCSTDFPNAPCPDGGDVCTGDPPICQTAPCSAQYPGGECPFPGLCVGGSCRPPPCGLGAAEVGLCPAGQVCCSDSQMALDLCGETERGSCVFGQCGPDGGVCPGPANLVDIGVHTGIRQVCYDGACVPPECNPTFTYGICPAAGTICLDGTCFSRCADSARQGWCPNGSVCVGGRCSGGCTGDFDCDAISDSDEMFAGCEGLADPTAVTCASVTGCAWTDEPCCIFFAETGTCSTDRDQDGSPDYLDRDADADGVPDAVEAGDGDIGTPPAHGVDAIGSPDCGTLVECDNIPNFRDRDSDGDHISDAAEAGAAPATPRNTDGDSWPDLYDGDSDNDGILDACEAGGDMAGNLCSANGIVVSVPDSDGDGQEDYRDTDSDDDGISDTVEARSDPDAAGSLDPAGVDHDDDGIPDYRDPDSDNDGVGDGEEDIDGDGVVACQLDGNGIPVPDARATPGCGDLVFFPEGASLSPPAITSWTYDYNLGCPAQKCLLAESSRIHPDTDGDGIGDGGDGVYLVCSAENLKAVNVFYSKYADYALALGTVFTSTRQLQHSDGAHVGFTFDDTNTARNNGSTAVGGFLLRRVPDATAIAAGSGAGRDLVEKALVQRSRDGEAMLGHGVGSTAEIGEVTLVLNRNFESFDGFGVVLSRYQIRTNSAGGGAFEAVTTGLLRDALVEALEPSLDAGFVPANNGPVADDFTLLTQTLYRWDTPGDGAVFVVAALTPTGLDADDAQTYGYRTRCSERSGEVACTDPLRPGCVWNDCASFGGQPFCEAAGCIWGAGTCGGGASCQEEQEYPCRLVGSGCDALDECVEVAGECRNDPEYGIYQIPLFFADNIANGGAIAQFGDDLAALCQSLAQENSKLDFLWVIDNSLSMETEIDQVRTSADLFIGLLNNSEADYRLGQATSTGPGIPAFGDPPWEPVHDFTDSNVDCSAGVDASTCNYVPAGPTGIFGCIWNGNKCIPVPRNGLLNGEFTGAIAGRTSGLTDRVVDFDCGNSAAERCNTVACGNTPSDCCSSCAGPGVIQDPSCYFAGHLPCTAWPLDNSNGYELGLIMGQWAAFRGGAEPACGGATEQQVCEAIPGCLWTGDLCRAAYCELPPAWNGTEQCNGHDPGEIPPGIDGLEDELEPSGCEWNPVENACVPHIGRDCYSAHLADEAGCTADPYCAWQWSSVCVPDSTVRQVLCNAGNQTDCEAEGGNWCVWDDSASECRPPGTRAFRPDAFRVAVFLGDEEDCYVKDHDLDGFCQFNPVLGYGYNINGYTDPVRVARTAAYRDFYLSRGFAVFAIAGDKADPTLPPGPGNGGCARRGAFCSTFVRRQDCNDEVFCVWNPPNIFSAIECREDNPPGYPVLSSRASCENANCVWAGSACNTPGPASCNDETSGIPLHVNEVDCLAAGCTWYGDPCVDGPANNSAGCYGSLAEAGNGYIDVAESTDGGWGSICAEDLLPTVEGIVIASLGRASPYVLEAQIGGAEVQPIAATIKVAVEVCKSRGQYPCNSGTEMLVAPRSRDNGFDYDARYNTLLLYGDARPVSALDTDPGYRGDIVVSYRYWVDLPQPVAGDPDCPCPETDPATCDCSGGEACGISGVMGGEHDDCADIFAQAACEIHAGCVWNYAAGGRCMATGLCDPDPTCGGCGPYEVCIPETGMCECDRTCGGPCALGRRCNTDTGSGTCGQCICDSCGHCAPGQYCDCGVCFCDITCGGQICPFGQVCNDDPGSPTCGTCAPPSCVVDGDCAVGYVCEAGVCVCDVTCGGCPAGQECDGDVLSLTCGQCLCDPTCGDLCPSAGLICDDNSACEPAADQDACNAVSSDDCLWNANLENCLSSTCGFCQPDPTCGGYCDSDCFTLGAVGCPSQAGCRWVTWANGGAGECHPITWLECNPAAGVCEIDPDCGFMCGPDKCNPNIGQCVCATDCSASCTPGQACDMDPASLTCGECLCDATCGGLDCPAGQICDDDPVSISCGICILDPDCGEHCEIGEICDPLTGLCVLDPECGAGCPSGYECDPLTRTCKSSGG